VSTFGIVLANHLRANADMQFGCSKVKCSNLVCSTLT
jgi:hypothetical protein